MQSQFITFEPKIAVQSARSLINYCERSGLLRVDLLKAASLSESQLNDSRLLVDVRRYEDLYRYASDALSDNILEFKYGQVFEPDRWGSIRSLKVQRITIFSLPHLINSASLNLTQKQKNGLITIWMRATILIHYELIAMIMFGLH